MSAAPALGAPAVAGANERNVTWEGAVAAFDSVARSYSSILFSRSRGVGLLLGAATLTSPRIFAFGLGAVVWANLVARLLRLDARALADGQFGYNALLVGLGTAATFTGNTPTIPVLALAVVGVVLLTAAFRASLGASGLPSLSLPFLAVYYLLLSASPLTHLAYGPYAIDPWPGDYGAFATIAPPLLPEPIPLFLRSLGSLFFVPRVDAGLLVLAALVLHSRIAALLAGAAFGAVLLLDQHVLSLPEGAMLHVLGYNTMLTAIALGSVWFVPSRSALGLALVGVLLCVMVTVGSMAPLARVGVPPMILPFNVTAILMLYAMRQRTSDGAPKASFSLADSPEALVAEHRSRTARFFALHLIRFRLPFRGTWICTQGNDGQHTHRDAWRHGLDFEVRGRDGELFSGAGAVARDFHAYGLPVVAAADGVVAKVVDGIPDNAIGRMDLVHNWGNVVVLYHAPGLYSVVAHLKPSSIKVKEGQSVRAGETLAACGTSGRSPTPHLHFQLQATAIVGAPTLPVHFHHVVLEREAREARETPEVVRELCPAQGDALRAIEPDSGLADLLHVPLGAAWTFESDGRRETVRSDVGLLGELHLRSVERPADLTFEEGDSLLVVLDVAGRRNSALQLLYAAMPRAPFDAALPTWTDVLPRQRFRAWPLRLLADLVALFGERAGIEVRYAMRREGAGLVIVGESLERRSRRDDHPLLSTRLEVERGVGPTAIEVTYAGVTRRATRILSNDSPSPRSPS
jgi:urea transporter